MHIANPLVSVIIPTYNRNNIISRAIDSVIKQTYDNIEIIVVDDGSTDNTKQILRQFRGKVKYIYKINGGVSSARNKGIEEAKGELIAFLDSDDYWMPDKIEKQIKYLIINKERSGVLTNYEFVDNGSLLKVVNIEFIVNNGDVQLVRLINNLQTMCTILMKKEVFSKVGYFDEKVKTAEDIDMLLRIVSMYNIGSINESLVKVYVDNQSLATKLFTGNRLIAIRKIKEYNPYFYSHNKRLINSIIAKLLYNYGKDLLWEMHIKDGRKQLIESIKCELKMNAFVLLLKSILLSVVKSDRRPKVKEDK